MIRDIRHILRDKRRKREFERESFEARKEMEGNAQHEIKARLDAVEVRFLNETRGRGDSS